MYQMLTGVLPYHTPLPSDLARLLSGELVVPPHRRNARIPRAVSDVVMHAMAPAITDRYQKASELLDDLLKARTLRKTAARAAAHAEGAWAGPSEPESRDEGAGKTRARETPQPRFCWHCRKPLHARSDRCPFCGEAQ
jgi:hypothetical protein